MRMRDAVNQSMIWKLVGSVSAINGLVCFGLSSTYNMTFGKLDFGGPLVYLSVGLITSYLIIWGKRIPVSERVQGVVVALIFVVICLVSVVHDKLVAGKSEALRIISYGSFALMPLSMSRNFELGFETGFSTFFLQLFAAQLFKINWLLLPIALVFSFVVIILRHFFSESRAQFCSSRPNGYRPIAEDGPLNEARIEMGDEDTNEEVSIESSQAMHQSPSNGQVSEGSILNWDSEQNSQEEGDRSALAAESSDQDRVSSGNNRAAAPPEKLRRSSSELREEEEEDS